MSNVSVRHILFALDSMPSWYPATSKDIEERLLDLYFDEEHNAPDMYSAVSHLMFLVEHGFVTSPGGFGWALSNLGQQEVKALRSGGHAPAYKIID